MAVKRHISTVLWGPKNDQAGQRGSRHQGNGCAVCAFAPIDLGTQLLWLNWEHAHAHRLDTHQGQSVRQAGTGLLACFLASYTISSTSSRASALCGVKCVCAQADFGQKAPTVSL